MVVAVVILLLAGALPSADLLGTVRQALQSRARVGLELRRRAAAGTGRGWDRSRTGPGR